MAHDLHGEDIAKAPATERVECVEMLRADFDGLPVVVERRRRRRHLEPTRR